MADLSDRQKEFLEHLLDLYRADEAPVHYTQVAQALNVNPVTAYDMLRLLEDKGMVHSRTVRPKGRRGRSIVVFSPTEQATAMLSELSNGVPIAEWETAKASILQALERGEAKQDYQALMDTLLQRIPERESPILFAADMITAIILVFYELRDSATAQNLFPHLTRFGRPGWAVLYSLAGFSLALSLVEKANRRATTLLLSQAQRFRENLGALSQAEKTRLSSFVDDIVDIIGVYFK